MEWMGIGMSPRRGGPHFETLVNEDPSNKVEEKAMTADQKMHR